MEIIGKQLDNERALYHSNGIIVRDCVFSGPLDGESALKESKNVKVYNSNFNLRYPFWHDSNLEVNDSILTENCRAAVWYSNNVRFINSKLFGIKAMRETKTIDILNCSINSSEFMWRCGDIKIKDSSLSSEYAFFESEDIEINNLNLTGKYSFQYTKNVKITNSNFNTKDSLWHADNVYVKDSIIKGEYLAWYSNNITFDHCKIIGTQPLCYCTNLKLIDCEMVDCDLSFEYSDVNATIIGEVDSIKNPNNGYIKCDTLKELIIDEFKKENTSCKIIVGNKTING